MRYSSSIVLIEGIILLVLFNLAYGSAFGAQHCSEPVGTLVSIEGSGEFQAYGQQNWQPVKLNDRFCAGDVLRVGPGGRAAVTLTNETILRINQNSILNFSAPEERVSVLELLKGMLHIFSHRPRALKVSTPYVNGTVEGTEFLVSADDQQAKIIVFEGLVRAANAQGSLDIASGQSVTASKGAAPQYSTVVNPRDAVQWTLYYPTILAPTVGSTETEADRLVSQASAALQTGQVGVAREALDKALTADPQNSNALALFAIIDVVQNRQESALAQARKAVELAPESAAAGLALSYAQQATFDVDGALDTLLKTAEANPDNAEILARLAELQLAVGRFDQALAAIDQAAALTPDNARIQAVQGFVHLTRVEIDEAQAAFNRAVELDQAMPLARLGLGLSRIRKGQVAPGRAEIEIGAALDTSNSLIRSYLGKAFFEEKRDTLAGRQYQIAKELDPADPTPWFYDAIRKQTDNRPVEALKDLQQSIALNDNRAVYRSRFLLDDDLAARSASLGRIYQDLGFQQLALAEGWKSVAAQPGNFSAHRFLSDSYRVLPRHEIARVSELLQAQLLQPLNINPVQPQLGKSDLAVLQGAGPGQASLNEYNSLFLRNRFALQASGIAGSNETLGDELVHSAVYNKLSYSIGQYYYTTDGIRENNDQRYEIYNGFVQGMASPTTSWMFELRYDEDETGDLTMIIDPAVYNYSPTLRQSFEEKSARAGFRHDFRPNSTLLGTIALDSGNSDITGWEGIEIFSDSEAVIGELQHLYNSDRFSLQSGVGYFYLEGDDKVVFNDPFPFETAEDFESEHANIYGYAQCELPHKLTATVGLSGDLVESTDQDREEINPKLGLVWQPAESTLVRGAIFKTVSRSLVNSQTIEPTNVAGFNQFFDDVTASLIWNYGVGIDQKFSHTLFAGAKYLQRDLEVPFIQLDEISGTTSPAEDDWREQIGSAYLYWAPVKWMSLGLEYFYEDFEQDEMEVGAIFGVNGVTNHRLVPQMSFFHPCGFSARIWANYVDQKRNFKEYVPEEAVASDQFWQVDAALSYRLPKRYGIVSLVAKNLFNEEFNYIDTDPANPRFLPEQRVFLSLTVQF
jgi:tetratricopeptide (TPR) repeat protein